jgi:RNA recognition motif-containing protein
LFIGNLDYGTTRDELQVLFAEAGEVVSVTVPTDRDSGRPRGFAFVEMASAEQAEAAVEKFNGVTLNGRAMRVNAANEKSPSGGGPRYAGFGGGSGGSFPSRPRSRPKGSRRNLRARKRSL